MRILGTSEMKAIKYLTMATVGLIIGAMVSHARVPEPDRILLGTMTVGGSAVTAADSGYEVEVRVSEDNRLIGSYRIGDNDTFHPYFYGLRVSQESGAPTLNAEVDVTDALYLRLLSDGVEISRRAVPADVRGQVRIDFGPVADTDQDGLSDLDEFDIYKTDPLNPDTDGDGLTDGEEVHVYGSDPTKVDTDGDGQDDGFEVKHGTDPTDPDSFLDAPPIPWPDDVVLTNRRPTFVWHPVEGATWYQIRLERNGEAYLEQWVNQVSATWTPAFALAGGVYSWSTRSWSKANGMTDWTTPAHFEIPVVVPAKVDIVGPSGEIAEPRPAFEWVTVEGATRYSVWINRNGQKYHLVETLPVASWTPTTDLPFGTYRWWVRAHGPDGNGAWSDASEFVYGVPLLISPTGATVERQPAFSWQPVIGATRYFLWLQRAGTKYETATISGATTWTPSEPLPPGQYKWWVQNRDNEGNGPWSLGAEFEVHPLVPGPLSLVSPFGMLSGPSVGYTWVQDPVATFYQLWIARDGQRWRNIWIDGSTYPGEVTYDLADHRMGAYTWWVRGWNPDGYGVWTEGPGFTIGEAAPVWPVGALVASPASVVWDESLAPAADHYVIWLNRNGTQYAVWDVDTSETVAGVNDRSYVLPIVLPAGSYQWWVRTGVGDDEGPWSKGLLFAVP